MKDRPARMPRHHAAPAAAPPPPPDRRTRAGPEPAPAAQSPWGDLPPLPQRVDRLDPYARRRQEQMLDDLIRAGLSKEQALDQLTRLEAGDLWSG